jgi:sec-independent protein translocase protein TatA
MFPKFGPVELILIIVIVTMLFGVGKLPEVFGSVGRGIREFRRNAASGDEATTTPGPSEGDSPAEIAVHTQEAPAQRA